MSEDGKEEEGGSEEKGDLVHSFRRGRKGRRRGRTNGTGCWETPFPTQRLLRKLEFSVRLECVTKTPAIIYYLYICYGLLEILGLKGGHIYKIDWFL